MDFRAAGIVMLLGRDLAVAGGVLVVLIGSVVFLALKLFA